MDVVPISATQGKNFMYVCSTKSHRTIEGAPGEDSYTSFSMSKNGVNEINSDNTIRYSMVVSTSDSTEHNTYQVNSLHDEPAYQL